MCITIMASKLRKWRYMPRVGKNGVKLRLLSEEEEDVHLQEGMKAEESVFSIDYDVWVDEQNRARRFDMTVHTFQSNVDMTMNSSYRFSKFNEPVVISPPKPSEVGDNAAFTQLLLTAAKAKKSA